MIHLRMTVASVGMTTISNVPLGKPIERSGNTVTLSVFPKGRDYLELITGEILCNPENVQFRDKKNKIDAAMLSINRAFGEEAYRYSALRYIPEVRDFAAASLYFHVFIPPAEFDDLMMNVRSGLIPASVDVELERDLMDQKPALDPGWEPDGSHLVWNNDTEQAKKGLPITSIKLGYLLSKNSDEVPQRAETTNNLLSAIRRDLQRFGWIFIGAAAVLMYLTRH